MGVPEIREDILTPKSHHYLAFGHSEVKDTGAEKSRDVSQVGQVKLQKQ